MNIIYLILKEIKQSFRDKKNMSMMILFPIILIIVLGSALKSAFSGNLTIETPKVLYKIESTSQSAKELKANFIDKGKEFNIEFEEAEDIDKAKESLTGKGDYACIIEMKEENKILIYKNDKRNLSAGLVEIMLSTYVQKYNSVAEIVKVNPKAVGEIISDNNAEYTQISSVNETRKPSSTDYYAVTMLTLIIMYGASTGLYGVARERSSKTRDRILSGPVKKYEFLIGKTLGGIVVTTLQVIIVIVVSKYALKTNWGDDIFTILLTVISLIVMSISMGVGLGFIFKKANVASGILNFAIPVMAFLAGAYISVDQFQNKTFQLITYLSPVRWTNKAVFGVIYNSDYSKVIPAIAINLAISVVFITICSMLFRKENV
jgi:ABC-2 type transport system permease protein